MRGRFLPSGEGSIWLLREQEFHQFGQNGKEAGRRDGEKKERTGKTGQAACTQGARSLFPYAPEQVVDRKSVHDLLKNTVGCMRGPVG